MTRSKLVAGALALAGLAADAKTVKVSDFGYDAEDSTRFVQAALDSGAERVIVDRQAKPWYVTPLKVRSNTEIAFEKGASVQAKYGSFKDEEDVLFLLDGVTNVTIRGGAAAIYRAGFPSSVNSLKHGWQHVIGMFGVSDVTIEDMELSGAGGDGIYLGCRKGSGAPCRNVTIRRCDCVRNRRQGISVIAADGLLIEDTVLRETVDADPSAGIDFEPNYPGQLIRNVVMRNCLAKDNRGNGFEVAVMYLDRNSAPVDILLENCRSEGNRNSLYVRPCHPEGNNEAGHCVGNLRLVDCTFVDPKRSPVAVQAPRPSSFFISSRGGRIVRKGECEILDNAWLSKNCPLSVSAAQKLPQRRIGLPVEPVVFDPEPGKLVAFEPFRVRGPSPAHYAVYAVRPGKVRFVARQWALGSIPAVTTPIKVTTADGNPVAELPMPGERDTGCSFEAPSAGFYLITVNPGRREFSIRAADVPIALDTSYTWVSARDTTAPLWAYVPGGCRGAFFVGGSGSGGTIGATLDDPSGRRAWTVEATDNWKAFELPADAPEGLWKFKVENPTWGPLEDLMLDVAEIPGYLFLTDRRHWRPAAAKPRRDFKPQAKTGKAVQAAIDAAAAAGGGRVVLGAGTYPSGTVYLKSRVELHLEKGAVLQGGDHPEDYDDVDDPRLGAAPEGSYKAFLVGFDLEDSAVTGRGTIDGRGLKFYDNTVPPGGRFFRKPPNPRPRMAEFLNCRGLRFEGVTFKDSPGWTFWLKRCENVLFQGATVCGDQRMINNDGLDIDSCRHVRIVDCDFSTGDDCLAIRAIRGDDGAAAVCEDLVVSDCRLSSACQGVRLGCPSDDTIRDILFENCMFRGNNAIMSEHPYGYLHPDDEGYCRLANIRFADWRIDAAGFAILLRTAGGIRLRDFGHMAFTDIALRAKYPIELTGSAEAPLTDVRFENVHGTIAEADPLKAHAVRGLSFDRFDIVSGLGPSQPLRRVTGTSWETRRKTAK